MKLKSFKKIMLTIFTQWRQGYVLGFVNGIMVALAVMGSPSWIYWLIVSCVLNPIIPMLGWFIESWTSNEDNKEG